MTQIYSYEEALAASKSYFNNSELPAKVFVDKYALRDKQNNLLESNPADMHKRIATELARIEAGKFSQPLSYDTIFSYLDRFKKIIPQGSILYGMGNYSQYVTLSNCYVLDEMLDSYGGIHYADEQISQISKRRGGCGTSLDHLRPAGMITKNSSRTTTGIIPFAERLSNSIREVGQNGRRGALMLTLNVHHPQILDFAKVKLDTTKVTGANLSVKLTDEFLNAVENNTEYEQRWPVGGFTHNTDGTLAPTMSRMVPAREVWNEIIKCAHEMAEPGLLFWDNIIKESPADCYSSMGFETIGTNPCSELPLSALDSCRLLLLNLMAYVKYPFLSNAHFDFLEFYKDTQIAQRLLDDIIDIELEHIDRILAKIDSDPEPEYLKATERRIWEKVRLSCFNGRRTGLGPTALGDCLAALGIKYGSDESIAMVEKIYQVMKFGSYRSSCDMAKELGSFPVWDWELEKDNPFIQRIGQENNLWLGQDGLFEQMQIDMFNKLSPNGEELLNDIKKYGRRNIANLTTAPAGSMSIMAFAGIKQSYEKGDVFGTSSGIEPAFKLDYTRRKKVNPNDEGVRIDFVDPNGDSWQEFKIYHPAVEIWMSKNLGFELTDSPWYGCCAEDIDWTQRVKLQAAAQRHVDHAISSTINLPEDVTVEKVAEIYETAWKSGCKGMTVYRKNCRTGVLIEDKPKAEEKKDVDARPKHVDCDVHHVSVKGKEYFVLVGMIDDKPYEVFAGRNGFLKKKIKHGTVTRVRKGYYKAEFEDGTELVPLTAASDEHEEAMTRLISTALHHGTEVSAIVNQLEKINGDMYGFTRAVSRALKKYIPDGTEIKGEVCPECAQETIIRNSGCATCSNCSWSKCL